MAAIAAAITASFYGSTLSAGWVIYALAVVFVGTRIRALRNIVHECSHYTFVGPREANNLFGHTLSILTLSSFNAYRREHLTHHQSLGDYEKDQDFARLTAFRFHEPMTVLSLARHILLPFTMVHLPSYISVTLLHPADSRLTNALRYLYIVALCVVAVYVPREFLLYFVVPFFFVFSSINYWTDCIDHGGILHEPDEFQRSRNFVVPAFIRVLFFPRNDQWHLIHHLMPFLAVRYFRAAHSELMKQVPEYSALTHDASKKLRSLVSRDLTEFAMRTRGSANGTTTQ